MYRKGQRTQARVGADVARRFFAADVLFSGRQGQHPATPAVDIDGFSHQPAGHLADVFVPGGEQPHARPTEIERIANRPALGGNDIRPHVTGRFQRAERHDLGHRDNQQRAGIVTGICNGLQIAHTAEKVGILDDHAGRVVSNM